MLKRDIRIIYKDMRDDLSYKEAETFADKIRFRLFTNFDFNVVKTVHIYIPKVKSNEINTWKIIEFIWDFFPHISVIVPKIKDDCLIHYYINQNTSYQKNKYNILEPLDANVFDGKHFYMVFVPLLAYDRKGYRVGYGSGYYDKMLYEYSANHIIGLSYFDPIHVSNEANGVHGIQDIHTRDMKMDYCISPQKIYYF